MTADQESDIGWNNPRTTRTARGNSPKFACGLHAAWLIARGIRRRSLAGVEPTGQITIFIGKVNRRGPTTFWQTAHRRFELRDRGESVTGLTDVQNAARMPRRML
ncbi:hypothetical protein [Fontivita pretiosa]|uniref:hypothetical protein n=1 Tax=Fontivita pretiosa TaxID=2989684 RepID=UPI003D1875B4